MKSSDYPFEITAFTGKGGEGKTFAAINTALAVGRICHKDAPLKANVLYMDCDWNTGDFNVNWDIRLPYTTAHYFSGACPLDKVIRRKTTVTAGVEVLTDILPVSLSSVLVSDQNRLENFFSDLIVRGYKYIVIDIGAGINELMFKFVGLAHTVVVVTNNNVNAVSSAADILKAAYEINPSALFSVLLNKIDLYTENHEIKDFLENKLKNHDLKDGKGSYEKFLSARDILKGQLSFKDYLDIRELCFEGTGSSHVLKSLREAMMKRRVFSERDFVGHESAKDHHDTVLLSEAVNEKKGNFVFTQNMIYNSQLLNRKPGQYYFTQKIVTPSVGSYTYGSLVYSAGKLYELSRQYRKGFSVKRIGLYFKSFFTYLMSYSAKVVKPETRTGDLPDRYKEPVLSGRDIFPEDLRYASALRKDKSYRNLFSKMTVMISAKGGVGQSGYIANAVSSKAYKKKYGNQTLVIDLNFTEKDQTSPFEGYLSGLEKESEEENAVFLKKEGCASDFMLFYGRHSLSFKDYIKMFLEILKRRNAARQYKKIIIDTSSGSSELNLMLAYLSGHVVFFSDVTDAESYRKLVHIVSLLKVLKEGSAGKGNPLTTDVFLTKLPEEFYHKKGFEVRKLIKHFKENLDEAAGAGITLCSISCLYYHKIWNERMRCDFTDGERILSSLEEHMSDMFRHDMKVFLQVLT